MKTRGRATSRLFSSLFYFCWFGFLFSPRLHALGRGGPSFSAIAIKQLLILASGLLMMLIIPNLIIGFGDVCVTTFYYCFNLQLWFLFRTMELSRVVRIAGFRLARFHFNHRSFLS